MIDPNIPLAIQYSQYDPLKEYGQIMSLQQMAQQQQLGALELQQKRQALADDAADRAAWQRYLNSGGTLGAPATQTGAGAAPLGSLGAAPTEQPTMSSAPAMAPVGQPLGPAFEQAPTAPAYNPPAAAVAPGSGVAPSQPPTAPSLAVPSVQDLGKFGFRGPRALEVQKQLQAAQETAAKIAKDRAEARSHQQTVEGAIRQHLSESANALISDAKKNGGVVSPVLLDWHLNNFAALGEEEAAQVPAIRQQLTQMDDAGKVRFLDSLVSDETRKANATAQTAQTGADRFDLEKPGLTPNANGLTPVQQKEADQAAAQLAQTKVRDANTARHETVEEKQGQQRIGQEGQNIALRTKAFNQQYGNPLEGATEQELTTARLRAAGKLPLPNPRTKGYDRAVAQMVAVDPSSGQYAGTRYDTIKSFKEKGDSDAIVQLGTALEHLDRLKTNSAAMGTEPTLGMNWSPTQRRYHQDVYNAVAEVHRLIANGVLSEHDGQRQISNLMSLSQSNRDAAIDELTDLMGGKVAAKVQKYYTGTGQALPAAEYFDQPTQERLKKHGLTQGIDFGGAAPAAPPAPAPKPQPTPAPTAPQPKPAAAVVPKAPRAGTVDSGYVFLGGDPSDKKNWKKAN